MKNLNIISACIKGDAITSEDQQQERLNILSAIENNIQNLSQWKNTDALILPGGFLFSGTYIGNLPFESRKAVIENTEYGKACIDLTRQIGKYTPHFKLITGIDSAPVVINDKEFGGDQMAVAFDQNGVTGIGRKCFPVAEDIDGKRMPPMIVYQNDFDDPHRVIRLGKNHKALLCACYDMFGIAARHQDYSPKLNHVIFMEDRHQNILSSNELSKVRRESFQSWKTMIQKQKIDLGIATIHRFQKPGREVFWQRHGIASASASLHSQFAAAAAHFIEKVPLSLDTATLFAKHVPTTHLESAGHRLAHCEPATDIDIIGDRESPMAVLRKFEL